jgi:dienelactone hydrolase
MSIGFRSFWVMCLVTLCFFIKPAAAVTTSSEEAMMPDAPMHERILRIPTSDQHPLMLQATVYTPSGKGPFPLLVMNHGSDGSKSPKDNPRSTKGFSIYYFLSRGYAVVLPMMRGYAGSEGVQMGIPCDFISIGVKNALDIQSVITYMSAQPYVDGSRVIVAGQSYGGWNTLAVGTLNIPVVKGLINFSGGLSSVGCPNSVDAMVDAAGYYGARTRTPSIWFYGSNDKIFAESTWRAAYRRYTAMGGSAELVPYGKFMNDSHNLLGFPEGLAIWAPKVDAYLAKAGMPHQLLFPEYLPLPQLPATHFADINDVGAVPYIHDANRQSYQGFLKAPLPRAFVIAETGGSSWSDGGFDPLGNALSNCRKQGLKCWPYAVDNTVVWVPLKVMPIPAASHFAALDNVQAIPYINDEGRETYRKFLSTPLPRVFLIGIDGSSVLTYGGVDPLGKALDACKSVSKVCMPYAIDNVVVWNKPPPIMTPTHFAELNDIAAVPYLDQRGKAGYQNFLTLKYPRAFAIAANGAWSVASGGQGREALDRALEACSKTKQDCRAYAVDDDVVWVR